MSARASMPVAALVAAMLAGAAVAAADPPPPMPYRIWWSFPNDDDTAIEVDNPDLTGSPWEDERWRFAVAMLKCNARRSHVLAQHKDGTPVREIRVESLEPGGKVRATSRCVMTLQGWRDRIGKDVVYRLDDELDAHAAFLMPRRGPGMPAKSKIGPDDVPLDAAPGSFPGTRGGAAKRRAQERRRRQERPPPTDPQTTGGDGGKR